MTPVSHVLLTLLVCAGMASAVDWSYTGDDGPDAWSSIKDTTGEPKYPDCGGDRQTPVDLTPGAPAPGPLPLQVFGRCSTYDFGVKAAGLEWKLLPMAGGTTCAARSRTGKRHVFLQMHTHSPSEHTVAGKHFDAEVHFVHKAADGALLVVGVFIEAEGTTDNAWFAAALKNATALAEAPVPSCCVRMTIPQPSALIPDGGRWYNYEGSLTTPPCSEIVEWWVAQRPVQVSRRQFKLIRELQMMSPFTDDDDGTNRPVQPLNGRRVRVFRS